MDSFFYFVQKLLEVELLEVLFRDAPVAHFYHSPTPQIHCALQLFHVKAVYYKSVQVDKSGSNASNLA